MCISCVNVLGLRRVVNASFYRQRSRDFPYLNRKESPIDGDISLIGIS